MMMIVTLSTGLLAMFVVEITGNGSGEGTAPMQKKSKQQLCPFTCRADSKYYTEYEIMVPKVVAQLPFRDTSKDC